jgi:hypothetical protein
MKYAEQCRLRRDHEWENDDGSKFDGIHPRAFSSACRHSNHRISGSVLLCLFALAHRSLF